MDNASHKALAPLHPFIRRQRWYRRVFKKIDDAVAFVFRVCFKVYEARPFYWIRSVLINRWHLVNMSGQLDYTWGYIDPSHAILLANFALLCRYVEKEHPFDFIDWEADPGHAAAGAEIKALYTWWKSGRPAEHAAADILLDEFHAEEKAKFGKFDWIDKLNDQEMNDWRHDHPKWNAWSDLYLGQDDRDDEMLVRLMKIRRFLWT